MTAFLPQSSAQKKKMEPEILTSNDNILISLSGLSVYNLIDTSTHIDACCPPPRQPPTFLRESLSLFFSSFPSTLARSPFSQVCDLNRVDWGRVIPPSISPPLPTPWNLKLNKQNFKHVMTKALGKKVVFEAYARSLI